MKEIANIEKEIIKNKEDYGICYSGGGLRACVLTYGGISELENMNIIDKIKYLSGVSGSTWFITGYTYYNDKIIFDKYTEPEDCNLSVLNNLENNTFGKTINNANLVTELIESFFNFFDRKINRWNTVVYECFFVKYGKVNKKINWSKLPLPIINSTISYDDVNELLFPIEFLPFYSCIPIYYKKNDIEYGNYIIETEKTCSNYDMVPYIQSAISSSFFEAGKELITQNRYKGVNYELFNPNTNKINVANLVDGGIYDNTGLIPLLRRKVSNININIHPNIGLTDEKFISEVNYFSSLFKGNPESEKYGIFKFGLWDIVYSQLIEKYNNGDPATILFTTEIESNEFFQIENYGPITFLIHVATCTKKWFERLPIETKNNISYNLNNLPNLSTLKYKYNPLEINLMYNLYRWDIKNSLEYQEFYSKINKTNI